MDVTISPERLVTDAIHQLILNPGSLQVMDFASGKIRLVAVKAVEGRSHCGSRASRDS